MTPDRFDIAANITKKDQGRYVEITDFRWHRVTPEQAERSTLQAEFIAAYLQWEGQSGDATEYRLRALRDASWQAFMDFDSAEAQEG